MAAAQTISLGDTTHLFFEMRRIVFFRLSSNWQRKQKPIENSMQKL